MFTQIDKVELYVSFNIKIIENELKKLLVCTREKSGFKFALEFISGKFYYSGTHLG